MKNIIKRIFNFGLRVFFSNKPNNLKIKQIENYIQLLWAEEFVGRRVYLGLYERPETIFFKKIIKPEDICLDIGSNIGYFTQLFASKIINGHVISLEANPKNAALINLNLIVNKFQSKVTLLNFAISDIDNQEIEFNETGDSSTGYVQTEFDRETYSYSENDHFEKRVLKIKTKKVDTILNDLAIKKIDVLKMDIEGYEFFALKGMENLLSDKNNSPRLMLIELVDEHMKYYGHSLKDAIEYVCKFGYAAKVLSKGQLVSYQLGMNNSNIVFEKIQ